MKNIYLILGLLTIAVSFSGCMETAHHKDALLDAVIIQREMLTILQEIITETLTRHYHSFKLNLRCMF